MTRLEKRAIWIVGCAILAFAVLLGLGYWRASIPPARPSNVSPDAVFMPPPPTPFPASGGDWVNCWFDSQQHVDKCQLTFVDGRVIYRGVYLPYEGQEPIPQRELSIDAEMMDRTGDLVPVVASSMESSEAGLQFVPLVYLRNGEVLIPEKAYAAGKKRLDELREARKP